MGIGAIVGGVLGAAGSAYSANKQSKAAKNAAKAGQFNPYDVTSAFGSGTFDRRGKTAQATLDPRYQEIADSLFGRAGQYFNQEGALPQGIQDLGTTATGASQGYLGQLQDYNPYDAAQTHFNRLDAMLAPDRQRGRNDLESRLLRQGRLGSTGGGIQQQNQEQAFQDARARMLSDSFTQAQGVQNNLANLGTSLGTFGSGIEGMNFARNDQLFGRGLDALNANIMVENLPAGLLTQGGEFGAQSSLGGARAAPYTQAAGTFKGEGVGGLLSGFGGLLSNNFGGKSGGLTGYAQDYNSRYGAGGYGGYGGY